METINKSIPIMNNGKQKHEAIELALKQAFEKLSAMAENQVVVTDIYLQPFQATAEIAILDDEDTELARQHVNAWDGDENEFYVDVQSLLLSILEEQREAGLLDALPLMKPYSFVLVDEERETIAELLLIDDDTLLLNNTLLQGLDDELNDFLKHLLE